MGDDLLLYGSYGYTGSLVARTAVERDLSPLLAGRDAENVERQATDLDLDHRVFSLEHPEVVQRQVEDVDAVLNCAGPFTETAEPLYEACLETDTDYLDIAGRIDVLERIAERDREAERAGVTLLPAVGFDVVATDCLASHLETRLLSATHLTMAIDGLGTFSRGTVKSMIEGLSQPDTVRVDGRIRNAPAAWRTREFDFGAGPKPAMTVPWGDVSTAYYTTGIRNIEVYATVPRVAITAARWSRPLAPLLGSKPLQDGLKALADAVVSGPSAEERERSSARVWGQARDDEDQRVTARLRTPDTYALTARTAVESARRVLEGEVTPGFQTPASAFGADFVLEFEGVEREDVPGETTVEMEPNASEN